MPEDDAQYTTATKAVDDRMRTDVLGPNVLRVLQDHKPVNDHVQEIVAEAIEKHPKVQKSLKTFVDDHHTNRKGVFFDRIVWLIVGAVVSLVIGLVALHLLGYHSGS